MRRYDLVICGGGPAGHAAARAYREAGGAGTVLVASADDRLPYARPPLSKDYLRGETSDEELALDDANWYRSSTSTSSCARPRAGSIPSRGRCCSPAGA